MGTAQTQWTNAALVPLFDDGPTKRTAIRIAPNKTLSKGQLLAMVSAQSAVQSITGTTSFTAGQYTISVFGMASDPIAFDANAAAIRTALAAIPAIGSAANVNVSGGPLNTSTPIVITFQGALANTPVPLVAVASVAANPLVGALASAAVIAHTTNGVSGQTFDTFTSAVVAVPSTAIVPTALAGGSIADATYRVYYTGRNANGATTLSAQTATVALSGGNNSIRIAAMAGLPAGLTHLDVYIASLSGGAGSPTYLGSIAVSSTSTAQTDFTALAASTAWKMPPSENTAYTSTGNTALMVLEYDCVSDSEGMIILGSASVSEHGQKQETVSAFYGGVFAIADLVGLNAKAVNDLRGRVIAGSIAGGTGIFTF